MISKDDAVGLVLCLAFAAACVVVAYKVVTYQHPSATVTSAVITGWGIVAPNRIAYSYVKGPGQVEAQVFAPETLRAVTIWSTTETRPTFCQLGELYVNLWMLGSSQAHRFAWYYGGACPEGKP
jgi:hypothetical protein